jgi:hypothetical protein
MRRKDHRTLFIGCGLAGFIIVMGPATLLVMAVNNERYVAHYPGAVLMPTYTRTMIRPLFIHDARVYRTADRPAQVQNWYIDQLGLRLKLDEGECKTLEGARHGFGATRTTTVLICESLKEQIVSVTRSISFR